MRDALARATKGAVLAAAALALSLPFSGGASCATLAVTADRDTIHVGDPIGLRLRLEQTEGEGFALPAKPRVLGDFEVLSWNAGPAKVRRGKAVQEGEARVTAWRVGALVLPGVRAEGDSALAPRSEPLRVVVTSVGLGKADDVRPLKEPATLPADRRLLFLIVAALALLAVAAWIIAKRLRKPLAAAAPEPVETRPAHEIAYAEMDRLAAERLVEAGRAEEHVARVADILRRYVEARSGFPAMEMTTPETLDRLREEWGSGPREAREALASLRSLLEEADLVKFAEVVPERTAAGGALAKARTIVDDTREREEAPLAAAS